jgi:hypothetical protein
MVSCLSEPATPSKKKFIVLRRLNIPLIAVTQEHGIARGMTWTPSEKKFCGAP